MKSKERVSDQLTEIRDLLAERDRQPLTLEEASCYLRLSKSQIYKLTSNAKIPHYKPEGKLIYFEKRELDDWIFRNRVKPNSELEELAIGYTVSTRGGRK